MSTIIICVLITVFVVLFFCTVVQNMRGKGKANWFFLIIAFCLFAAWINGYCEAIKQAELLEVTDEYYTIEFNGMVHIYDCDEEVK